ncbi:MAG: cation transporter [Deltaproteobacteria bacterium]|nr:cation transporter [Deltaproteobacteria bacterium]
MKGKKLGISIVLNVLITVAQVIGGFVSGSLSLLSDATHNFSDVISLFISYIANQLTKRKYTPQQTFGYKRAEIIAALINAATLLAIAVMLAGEAISRFNHPVEIESSWVITLAALSILVNGVSVLLLRQDASESMNMRSAYLHLFSDMITSVGVLLGGMVMYYFHLYWIDSALSILIAAYLVYSSGGLLMQTLGVLMQFAPPGIDLKSIEIAILKFTTIKNIHHVHLWQLTDQEIHFEAHIDFEEDMKLSEAAEITQAVAQLLREKFDVQHVILQPEIGSDDSKRLIIDENIKNR